MTIETKYQSIYRASVKESQGISSWLHHQHSLTDKLKEATGSAQVKILSQSWRDLSWWETYLLGVSDGTMFHREILMSSHDKPFWYARTMIPETCYQSGSDFFGRLAHESIRNLIFDNDDVHRIALVTYPIDRQCTEYYWVKQHLSDTQTPLWVRLAEYSYLGKHSFYLVEVLFPELERL